jgi:hypothetical protein
MPPPDLLTKLRSWLPYTIAGQRRNGRNTDPALSVLLKHPGLEAMALDEEVHPVLGAARMLSGDSLLPNDHMVRTCTAAHAACHCLASVSARVGRMLVVVSSAHLNPAAGLRQHSCCLLASRVVQCMWLTLARHLKGNSVHASYRNVAVTCCQHCCAQRSLRAPGSDAFQEH